MNFFLFKFSILLLCIGSARAITVIDTLNWDSLDDNNPYIQLARPYDAVGFLQWETGTSVFGATGTLVNNTLTSNSYSFLTAAHNVDGNQDGVADASSYNIFFGDNTSLNGSTADLSVTLSASSVNIHPFWSSGNATNPSSGISQYDMAVMTFTSSSLLPMAMNISYANPLGQTGTLIGYGTWGNGLNFTQNTPDGIRRAANNVVDIVGDPFAQPNNIGVTLQSDFDNAGGTTSSSGNSVQLFLEGSTSAGDSGGPLIVQNSLVGVLNGGFNNFGDISEYGDRAIWAWAGEESNQNFLRNNSILLIPEPKGTLLLIVSVSLLVTRRSAFS